MKKPDITILMSVYNGRKFLSESVDSILSQTYPNFVFLILDDGSTDSSLSYLKSLKDERIQIISYNENLGLTKRLNSGLKLIKTQFIVRMDSDDIAFPNRLEVQRQYMLDHPNLGMIGCQFIKIDEKGNKIGESVYPQSNNEIRETIFKQNPISHSCLLIRTDKLKDIGGYNENFRYSQDYELTLRMCSKYEIENLSEKLMYDRLSKGSLTANHPFHQAWCYFIAQILGLTRYHYSLVNFLYLPKTVAYLIHSLVLSL